MNQTLFIYKIARTRLRNLIAAAVLLCFFSAAVAAKCQDGGFTEYHVKALFLFNFAKYVQWPEQAFSDTNAPITIGIVGEDKFGDDLPNAVEGKTVGGRSFAIKHLSANDNPQGCQILFISDSESSQVGDILQKVGALPILTVGEDKSFSRSGGIINFILKDGNVRLEINLDSASRAGLKISSKLLAVADTVRRKEAQP